VAPTKVNATVIPKVKARVKYQHSLFHLLTIEAGIKKLKDLIKREEVIYERSKDNLDEAGRNVHKIQIGFLKDILKELES